MADIFDELAGQAGPDVFDEVVAVVAPPPLASTAGTATKLSSPWQSLKRGVVSALGIPDVLQAVGTAGISKPTIARERKAFVAAMTDPRYQEQLIGAGDDRAKLLRVESMRGPAAKLDTTMLPARTLEQANVEEVAKNQERLASIPTSPAQERLGQAQSVGEKWDAWRRDPVELTATIVLESLPPSIAGAVLGAPGGPGGMAAGVGLSSAAQTFSGEFLGAAARAGVNLQDPDALQAFLDDEKRFRPAFSMALSKAGIVGGVDAATAGTAGRFIEPALKQGLMKRVIATGKEVGLQAAGGAGGEAAAQVATGQPLDVFDIAMEAIAEVATTPGEIAGNLRQRKTATVPKKGTGEPDVQPASLADAQTTPPARGTSETPAPRAVNEEAVRAAVTATPGGQIGNERQMERLPAAVTDAGLTEAVPPDAADPVSQRINDLAAAVQGLKEALVGNQIKGGEPRVEPQKVQGPQEERVLTSESQLPKGPGSEFTTPAGGATPSAGVASAGNLPAGNAPPPPRWQPTPGKQAVVNLTSRGRGRLARVVAVQPDGSAQVRLEGEKEFRWVNANQLRPTGQEAARLAKAAELAEAKTPEAAAQMQADAREFDTLVSEFGPHPDLNWLPAEALETADVKSQGVVAGRLRESGRRNAARAAGVANYQDNSVADRARALPALEAFLRAQFPGDTSIDRRRAVEQFSKREPEATPTAERQVADQKQVERIRRENPSESLLQRLRVAEKPGRARVSKSAAVQEPGGHAPLAQTGSAKPLAELERLFGVRIILVESAEGGPAPFHGYKDRSSNVILVDGQSAMPVLVIAGHELLHHIKTTHPGLYEDLRRQLLPLLRDMENYRARLQAAGYGAVEAEVEQEELLADFTGDALADPTFLESLARQEPNLFKRFARIAIGWLDKLIAKVKGLSNYGSSEFISDIESARAVLADTLKRAATAEQVERFEAGEQGGQFSRKDEQSYLKQAEELRALANDEYNKNNYQEYHRLNRLAWQAERRAAVVRLEKQGITAKSLADKNLPTHSPSANRYEYYTTQLYDSDSGWGAEESYPNRKNYYEALVDFEASTDTDKRLVKVTRRNRGDRWQDRWESSVEVLKRPSFVDKLLEQFPGMDRSDAMAINARRNPENEDPYLVAQAWVRHQLTGYDEELAQYSEIGGATPGERNAARAKYREQVDAQMEKWSTPKGNAAVVAQGGVEAREPSMALPIGGRSQGDSTQPPASDKSGSLRIGQDVSDPTRRDASGQGSLFSLTPDEPAAAAQVEQVEQIVAHELYRTGQPMNRFTVVYRPGWTRNGRSVQAMVSKDGRATINAGARGMDNEATVRRVVREEAAHLLLSSQEGRAAVRRFALEALTPEAEAELRAQGYTGSRELLADEFIAKQARENTTWWQNLVEQVRAWLAKRGLTTLTPEETARAILRSLKSKVQSLAPETKRHSLDPYIIGQVNNARDLGDTEFEVVERRRPAGSTDAGKKFYAVTGKQSGNTYFSSPTPEKAAQRVAQMQEALRGPVRSLRATTGVALDKRFSIGDVTRPAAPAPPQSPPPAPTPAAPADAIAAAEQELKTAIRQHMNPPEGMTKKEALQAKNDAASKLRRLVAEQLKAMSSANVDAVRSPQETADLISQTVDLLNSIQDEISERTAKDIEVPADLTKLRQDLQTRLNLLKGWADQETDGKGQKAEARTGPRDARFAAVESATDPERDSWGEWWDKIKRGLRYLTSPIPELPLFGEQARKSALFRRGYRLFAVESNRVRKEAADKLQRVLEPLTKLGRNPADNAALQRYYRLGEQLRRFEMDEGKQQPIRAEMARLEAQLERDPFNLFRKIVLYRDLYWRGTYLKTPEGKPITLPLGLTPDDARQELRRLTDLVAKHKDGAAVAEALKRHYELTDELQKSILDHGEIIPEALRNPLYFPHHMIDSWTGNLDRVKPTTEEDFRRYLITPLGSGGLIQSDYLKAMMLHTADVLAHNARVDLVQKYWQPYDISERLKREHGEAWNKPWNLPPGYRLYAPFKKLPLRMDYILSREVLADKLGVLFNDGDLRERMGEVGKVLKVKPEDLHAALVAGEKIQWALPEEIADALEGITRREAAESNPGLGHAIGLPFRKLNSFWKATKLFAPWNWIRYEYGNLSTDAIDKVLAADPGAAKHLARAAREVWASGDPKFEASPEFAAAQREGVFDTVTAGEAGRLIELPAFREFMTPGEKRLDVVKRFLSGPARGSKFREATFRYANFLGNLERLRAGNEPVYAGAFHGDIDALGEDVDGQRRMLEGEELNYAKAAEISLKTFGDYSSISQAGQWLRQYAVPFWSWQDVNFRYHANQLRNLADGLMGKQGDVTTARKAALRYAGARVISTLVAVGLAKELWNQFGGALAGLWDDDDDLEKNLSATDRRRGHIILGQDANGQTMVVYTPSAWSDIAEWVGGQNMKRLLLEWARGQITLDQVVSDYAKMLGPDSLNKLAQSVGPIGKSFYELTSGKATFPDVFDQRNIPAADKYWRLIGTLTDDRIVNSLRAAFDRDFYSQPASEQLQQIILQVRRRDPESWAYYEVREDAADWKEARTGKRFEAGAYDAPEAMALRNFRRAIYRADVANALRLYERLQDYGYTAERLDASIRAQHPLADLNAAERKAFVAGLTAGQRRELDLAMKYYGRMSVLDKREKQLFPSKRQPNQPANPALLERIVEGQRRNQ